MADPGVDVYELACPVGHADLSRLSFTRAVAEGRRAEPAPAALIKPAAPTRVQPRGAVVGHMVVLRTS